MGGIRKQRQSEHWWQDYMEQSWEFDEVESDDIFVDGHCESDDELGYLWSHFWGYGPLQL